MGGMFIVCSAISIAIGINIGYRYVKMKQDNYKGFEGLIVPSMVWALILGIVAMYYQSNSK